RVRNLAWRQIDFTFRVRRRGFGGTLGIVSGGLGDVGPESRAERKGGAHSGLCIHYGLQWSFIGSTAGLPSASGVPPQCVAPKHTKKYTLPWLAKARRHDVCLKLDRKS